VTALTVALLARTGRGDNSAMHNLGGDSVLADDGPLRAWGFDSARLSRLAAARADSYRTAHPFPYLVVDDLFPDELLAEVVDHFPAVDDAGWHRHDDHRQRKLQWSDPARLSPPVSQLMGLLQSGPFINFLEEVTGISGLIADPHCFHGGPHLVERGGYLKIHSDQALQETLHLYRRVNVIVYLNPDWDPAWGGALELWGADMAACQTTIDPRRNRMVIFDVQPGSNHGHPEPLVCPPEVARRSIALYYYTSADNPSTPRLDYLGAQLRARPGERLEPRRTVTWRSVARDLCPPLVSRTARRVTRRATPSRW